MGMLKGEMKGRWDVKGEIKGRWDVKGEMKGSCGNKEVCNAMECVYAT